MSVTLVLDPSQKTILEPGYRQRFGAREMGESLQVGTSDGPKFWRDPVLGVLMLYPQQLRPDWLNSIDQVSSIIRYSDMYVNPTDVANSTVFEEFGFGNGDNFYIYHSPIGFPGTPSGPMPFPGAGPSLVGVSQPSAFDAGLATLAAETEVPYVDYSAPDTPTGSVNTGKVIARTRNRLAPNQAVYLRWFSPNPKIGHQTRYVFHLGQLAIEIVGNVVTLWTDYSPQGDRSLFTPIFSRPMFGQSTYSPGENYDQIAQMNGSEGNDHDRSLLVIPYFRNRVLLYAGAPGVGSAYAPRIKANAVPTGDPANPWDITREDTLMVWCITPAPGRFQVQKVRYATGPVTVDLPPIVIDYTPSVPPAATKYVDTPQGTTIGATISFPVAYTRRFNSLNACPPATTITGVAQGRTYGVQLTFAGESTHRWTPFFYGMDLAAAVVLQDSALSPSSVLDTGTPTTNIQHGSVSWGDKPGDGRMTCKIIDETPFAGAGFYYRSRMPVQLLATATACFTGFTEPHEAKPWHASARPREVVLHASDRWRQLAETYLRDQVSYEGVGHITTVLRILAQAGVDPATAETPPLTAVYNTPLAWLDTGVERTETQAKLLKSAWEPDVKDTAGTFIKKIANLFSGWDVGFRGDGTFYYLPKDWFTGVSLRFYHSAAAAALGGEPNNPLVRDPVQFTTIPPEANAVAALSSDDKTGKVLQSSLWIDYASINNPSVVNWVGTYLPIVVELSGSFGCAEINRVARVVWEAARRRRRMIEFVSDFVPTLKLGQIIEVGTYGQYRLKGLKAEFIGHRWDPATYYAELVESGVGL